MESALATIYRNLSGAIPLSSESAFLFIKMNNVYRFFYSLILVTLAGVTALRAGGNPLAEVGRGTIYIYGGGGTTTNYYNINGIIKPFDTLGTTFTALTFGLTASYGILDNIELNID